jgi:8-oxo-dGTP diphosphatase
VGLSWDYNYSMEKTLAEIVLVNSKNQILLQHRTRDAPTFPNMYCIFGGKVEEGERPEDAVKRECYEELEYTLSNPKLILNFTIESVLGKRNKFIFTEKYNESKELVLHEGQGMVWVGKDDYSSYNIIDHDLVTIQKIFEGNLLTL